MSTEVHDAIVIGAGPSGVSCALWLKQLGYEPVVVDRNASCGGLQLLNSFTNTWIATSANAYGKDVAAAMHANMVRHKVEMRLGVTATAAVRHPSGWSVAMSSGANLYGRFLVLAAGTSPKKGGFSNRVGMIIGPGPGVANTNFSGAKVAILGGGDSAFENYDFVKRRGALTVKIYARSIRARAEMLSRATEQDVQLGDYMVNELTRTVNGETYDHIIVLYGYEANRSSLLGLEVGMRTDGFVLTDNRCQTTIETVFAIGEIAQRAHPCCVTAMADGVTAAKEIQRRCELDASTRFAGMAKRSISLLQKVVQA
jgi:thioredoxin reductase (NADPH)